MKIKASLLCLTITAIASANSFALELYKGRVINHKEWTTGNVKATFKDSMKNATSQFKNKMMTKSDSTYASIYSNGLNTKGATGVPVTINGNHSIYVMNDTQAAQQYNYTLSICANTSENTTQCAYYYDEIQLEAGGYVVVDKAPVLEVKFSQPGIYKSHTSTNLMTRPDVNSLHMVSGSSSENSVEIS